MIRMETDTTPLYHRIQLGCQDTRTLITLQTFDGAHSNGEVGRIERRQAHGENRKRKGFLIGGVRLQWRRASGLEGRPWYRSFATGSKHRGSESSVEKQAESGKYSTRHRDHYQTAARIYSTRPMNEPWKTLR